MAVGQTNVANMNARPRRRRRVLATTVVVILAAAGAGYLYLRGQQGAQQEAAAGPETVTVTPRPYRILVAGPGTLQPARSLEVSADVNGRVVDMVELGDRITEGAEVATFEPVAFERALLEAQLNLDKAQAQLESLQANLAESSGSLADSIADAEHRVEDALLEWTNASEALALSTRLHTLGSESDEALADAQDSADQAQRALVSAQADLETLKASQQFRELANAQDVLNASIAVRQAEIDLARAQDDLDATSLTAPFTGVVAELSAQAGSNLSTNQPLFTLIEDSTLELITQIDETEIALVATGLVAELTLDALPDAEVAGRVTTIAPIGRIEQNIPVFEVTIEIDNADLRLRPGMTAEAEIIVREVDSTVTVPSRAVRSVRSRSYIQVLQADGEFGLARVEVVDTVGFNTIVAADLAPGTEVLVAEAEPTEPQQATRPRGFLNFGRGR